MSSDLNIFGSEAVGYLIKVLGALGQVKMLAL